MTQAAPLSSALKRGLAVAAAVVVVDQITKEWAVSSLTAGQPKHVWWTLQWNLVFNKGMSFSAGQGAGVLIGIVASIVAIVLLASLRNGRPLLGTIGVGLIAGGAIGNVIDRLFRGDGGFLKGGVVDFVDVQWWPIWNVADMCVVVGAVVLALGSFREGTGQA